MARNDRSVFQGWLETETHRAEWLGGNSWALYRRQGGAFVRYATVTHPRRSTMPDLLAEADDAGESCLD